MATWQNEDDHKTHTLCTGVTITMVPATWEAPKDRKRKSTSRIRVQSVRKRKKLRWQQFSKDSTLLDWRRNSSWLMTTSCEAISNSTFLAEGPTYQPDNAAIQFCTTDINSKPVSCTTTKINTPLLRAYYEPRIWWGATNTGKNNFIHFVLTHINKTNPQNPKLREG